jgi:hypothetical protein
MAQARRKVATITRRARPLPGPENLAISYCWPGNPRTGIHEIGSLRGYLPGLPPPARVGDGHDHELAGLDAVEDAKRWHGPVALRSPGDVTAKARELLCRKPLGCSNHGSSLDWCPVSDLLQVLEGPVLPQQTHTAGQ